MKLMKVTTISGEKVWLSPLHVTSVHKAAEEREDGAFSNICINDCDDAASYYAVRETPEQVAALFEAATTIS